MTLGDEAFNRYQGHIVSNPICDHSIMLDLLVDFGALFAHGHVSVCHELKPNFWVCSPTRLAEEVFLHCSSSTQRMANEIEDLLSPATDGTLRFGVTRGQC